jgi:hypothetical protein
MNSGVFKTWYAQQFLPYLVPESAVTMDNASIHLVLIETVLYAKMRERDIMAWLHSKYIPPMVSQTRVDLLQLVQVNKLCKCYEYDTTATVTDF